MINSFMYTHNYIEVYDEVLTIYYRLAVYAFHEVVGITTYLISFHLMFFYSTTVQMVLIECIGSEQ